MGLSIVSKKQLWDVEPTLPVDLDRPGLWHLKSIQDAMVFDSIGDVAGKRILEVGGGLSRLLPWLSRANECVLADPLDGRDGGPKRIPNAPYEVVAEEVGANQVLLDTLKPFDLVFSVSVVEHVPLDQLDGFFGGCRSVLKSGGRMIHLIDLYVTERLAETSLIERLRGYLRPLEEGFRPRDPSMIIEPSQLRFETWMATNPDNMMSLWNKSVPELRERRETHQSISLLMDYTKVHQS
jgi:hypothetical protein